jgi:hypothetical protein
MENENVCFKSNLQNLQNFQNDKESTNVTKVQNIIFIGNLETFLSFILQVSMKMFLTDVLICIKDNQNNG